MGYTKKFKPNCRICVAAKSNPKLKVRIYHAAFEREEGDETLRQIAIDDNLTEHSLYNHVKKHIKRRSDRSLQVQKKAALIKAKMEQELEISFDHDSVVPEEDFEKGMRLYLAAGIDALEKGKMAITAAQFVQVMKVKSDYMSKRRGQDVEVLKTVYQTIKKDGIRTPTNVS